MDREIFITREITMESAAIMVQDIKRFEKEGAWPIKIYINCYGGPLAELFTILDALESCRCEKITINIGEADSAASLILACGDRRYATKNSRVMLHEIQLNRIINNEPLSRIDADMKEYRIMQDRYLTELARLCKKEVDQVKKDILGKDLYLSAEEAIEYGIVDEILTTKIKERYNLKKADTAPAEGGNPQNTRSEIMEKDQMLAALKKDHGIDLADLSAKLEKSDKDNADLKAENETLSASKKDAEDKAAGLAADLEAVKKERVFDQLVAGGKEAESVRADVLKAVKTADEIKELYKNKPVVFNVKADGKSAPPSVSEITNASALRCIKEGVITEEEAKKYLKKDGK